MTVNLLVYIVTQYMYDAQRRDFALSASFVLRVLKSLLKKIRRVRLFVWKGILKNTPLSSKIHCYVTEVTVRV